MSNACAEKLITFYIRNPPGGKGIGMVNYWLISGLRENLEVGIRTKMWALNPEKAETEADKKRLFEFIGLMHKGDIAALRVVEFRAGRMISARIVGFAKIDDVFYEERYPIWPDERRGKPIYPWKIRFSDVIALSPDNWPRIGLKPLTIPDERFLSGIGLGLLLPNEYVDLIKRAEQRWGLMINL